MINRLAMVLETFPGSANRTRCFAHILNLVAKCIMKQFDALKKPRKNSEYDLEAEFQVEDLEDELEGLNGDLDNEDEDRLTGRGKSDDEDDEEKGLDGREGMTEAEINKLEQSVKPVQHVLAKVTLLSKQLNLF